MGGVPLGLAPLSQPTPQIPSTNLLPALCSLLNSNKFTLIGDNAFTGLSHLQYLYVFPLQSAGVAGRRAGGRRSWQGRSWTFLGGQ